MGVTGIDAKECGGKCIAIVDVNCGANAVGFRQLINVRALKRPVVGHDISAVDTARIAYILGILCVGTEVPVVPSVANRESGRNEQMDVAVLIVADAVIEGLCVKVKRTT